MVITETAEIGVDVERMWREVGEFGTLNHWHPLVTALDVRRQADGDVRTANPRTPREQVERLRWEDASRHSYEYTLEHTHMPVRDFTGAFRLEELAPKSTRVIWSVRFELSEDGDETTVEDVAQFLHAGMGGIKEKYRAWILGEPRGVQRDIARADKRNRTGSESEPVRDTPPAGAWNDVSSD